VGIRFTVTSIFAATLLGLLGSVLVACGSDKAQSSSTPGGDVASISEAASSEADTGRPCPSTVHPELKQQLPAGFPVLSDWMPIELVTQGKTQAFRGQVAGSPADIPAVRDRAVTELIGVGLRKTGSDEEAGFEADADFSGNVNGAVNVRVLCKSRLILTYTIEH